MCRYCGEETRGTFRVRPLFLASVLIITAAFCAATVFANRFYQSKQLRLGQMWFARGEKALDTGNPRNAILDLRNALYYSHDDPTYRLRLAEALVADHRMPEAQAYLLTLWQDEPSNGTINLELARLATKQGETQAALRYYHGAIYGAWPDGEAAVRRQQTRLELIHYLLSLHNTTQADSELIALLPELPREAAAHTQVGWLLMQAGDLERALQEFEEALHLNPKDSSAVLGAGQTAFHLAQYRLAHGYLDQAVRLQSRSPQAEELLATTRLILGLDPYQHGLNSRQRAERISRAFQYARRRLDQCTAVQSSSLPPSGGPGTQPSRATTSSPVVSPQNPAAGLLAKILGKREPVQQSTSALPPVNVNAAEMQQLLQQVTQLGPRVRSHNLERDPQFADLVMGLVTQIETVTAQQCGNPSGADLALLLLARQGDQPQ